MGSCEVTCVNEIVLVKLHTDDPTHSCTCTSVWFQVTAKARRRGVATALYNHVEQYCLEEGYTRVVLTTTGMQAQACQFYAHTGFDVVHRQPLQLNLWPDLVRRVYVGCAWCALCWGLRFYHSLRRFSRGPVCLFAGLLCGAASVEGLFACLPVCCVVLHR